MVIKERHLILVDLTKPNEKEYITFFFHGNCNDVYKVKSNGMECSHTLKDKVGIHKQYRATSKLPKYIIKSIPNYEKFN
tara:strand:- start:766 stop:1002 length:237 start_codon:yes stop_codon:yes gene_type:complete